MVWACPVQADGVDLPNTRKLIMEQIRTHSTGASWNLVYETLTHADLPVAEKGQSKKSQRNHLKEN